MESKLKESIVIMARINNQLKHANSSLDWVVSEKREAIASNDRCEETIFKINTVMFSIIHYSFVWYVCFLDEYNCHFIPPSDASNSEQLLLVKKKCKPYLKGLREKFGDIKQARNSVLAHGYRDGDHNALSNQIINKFYDGLFLFPDLAPFSELSRTVQLIVDEIQSQFGMVSEDDLSLIDDEPDAFRNDPEN